MGFENGDYVGQRIWASPPEIFKAGAGGLTIPIQGKKFLMRSDFPVQVYFDGKQVGAAGGLAFPGTYKFEIGRSELSPRNMTLRFPPGFGADSSGALVQAQILGRHGNFMLATAWSDMMDPQDINPDLLPTTCIILGNLTGTAGTTNPNWGTQTQAQSIFTINGVLPKELYVKGVSVNVEMGGTFTAHQGIYVYEWQLKKTNVPAGDVQFFGIWNQSQAPQAQGITYSPTNFKLPLRSIFSQYAAETPTMEFVAFGSVDPLINPVVHARLFGGYVLQMPSITGTASLAGFWGVTTPVTVRAVNFFYTAAGAAGTLEIRDGNNTVVHWGLRGNGTVNTGDHEDFAGAGLQCNGLSINITTLTNVTWFVEYDPI